MAEIRGIEDIECITPDLAGVPRGKMMPTSKFTSNTSLALPSAIYRHTISGEYPDETESFRYEPRDSDIKLVPDLSTLSVVPWETDPTAQVICDIVGSDGEEVSYTPRNVLKRVLKLYGDAAGSLSSRQRSSSTSSPRTTTPTIRCIRQRAAPAARSSAVRAIRSPASTSSTN